MPLRILQIVPTLDRYGTGKQVVLLAAELAREDFDVHVCAVGRGGPLVQELRRADIPVEVVGRRWKADPLAYAKLRRNIRRLRPDIVHTWSFAAGVYGRHAALAERVSALVHSERRANLRQSRWESWIERRLAKRTARLVANTPGVAESLVMHGLPQEKLAIIPDGVPPAAESDVRREELLSELGLSSEARLIGAVGGLVREKRLKDAIWAAELTSVLHPAVHLLIVGDGPQRQDLERFASLASTLDRVRFLGQRDDVWRILPHLDVLWQGGGHVGLSTAVLEAMAAGVPVVAADTSGNRELVVPDETGFLVPIAGRAEYARATNWILSDADLARRMGDAGRRRALAQYSIEEMVRAYHQLYREVVRSNENRYASGK